VPCRHPGEHRMLTIPVSSSRLMNVTPWDVAGRCRCVTGPGHQHPGAGGHRQQLVGGHHPDGLEDRDAPVGPRRGGDGQANTVDPARDGPAHPGHQSQLDPLGYKRWGRDKRNSAKHMAGRGPEGRGSRRPPNAGGDSSARGMARLRQLLTDDLPSGLPKGRTFTYHLVHEYRWQAAIDAPGLAKQPPCCAASVS
jgi:hypothetical protein